MNVSPAQIIFAFARAIGILPLTGTSSETHMKLDLASPGIALPLEAIDAIESLAG
jgi:diketogulonate reductase-like aldo/keto reductase